MTDTNPGVDLAGHPDVTQDFTYECVYGCTVQVVRSAARPHDCAAVPVLRLAFEAEGDAGKAAELAAEALAPLVRELRHAAWECPTCSWPSRETAGTVCQTCGTDYAPEADPAARHEHEWTRCPTCPNGDGPCACSGMACCDGERAEIAAEDALTRYASEKAYPHTPYSVPSRKHQALRAFDALRDVLALHYPMGWYTECPCTEEEREGDEHQASMVEINEDYWTCDRGRDDIERCHECTPEYPDDNDVPWPCPTVKAITANLAGDQ